MINKLLDYLNLRSIGAIELSFALMLILGGYSFKGVPLSLALPGVLFLILLFRPKLRQVNPLPIFTLLVGYVLIHDFIYLFVASGNINAYLNLIVNLGLVFLAVGRIDIEKFKGSLNLVALISMVGLLFQWVEVAAGGGVRPIQLPFLDMQEVRLEYLGSRPSSFFMEPAAYAAFMYVPLMFSLIDKKYIWSFIIILSDFLTTSTIGIVTSFIMLLVYVFTQKVSTKTRLLTVLMGGILAFALLSVDAFQGGVDKMENEDIENNTRTSQGPYIVSTMQPYEMVFGSLYPNATDYCLAGRAPDVQFASGLVFISTTWLLILIYGFVGLVLYLLFYYRIGKRSRETIPLIACLIATMFSSSYSFTLTFVYTSVSLMLVMNSKQKSN